ncbi:MAG TPA: hypothetical protein VHE78_06165 [Gemmatimonadaceae bacterium]|nr:hypothetical protein [Gemmatimonadaceae bacterium]
MSRRFRHRVGRRRYLAHALLGGLALTACGVTDPSLQPPGPKGPMVASGGGHSCALAISGQTFCWGSAVAAGGGVLGEGVPPRLIVAPALVSITAGDSHSCGIDQAGNALCWGVNARGELGDGTNVSRTGATPVVGGLHFSMLAGGDHFTCGLTRDGDAYCWGDGESGQLGDGVDSSGHRRRSPVRVVGGHKFTSIAVARRTCALDITGAAFCWGVERTRLGASIVAAQSADSSCSTTYDMWVVHCATPTALEGSRLFRAISVGTWADCAVELASVVYCWGSAQFGMIGDGSLGFGRSRAPVRISGGLSFAAVSAAATHVCALALTGDAWCWGNNFSGFLGTGTTGGMSTVPVRVTGGIAFQTISAVAMHTCALASTNGVYCWGVNFIGELGQPRTLPASAKPLLVPLRLGLR